MLGPGLEDAFDRLHQDQISKSMGNPRIPEALSAATTTLYSNPTCWTKVDKTTSSNTKQKRGIRQVCTLSPYIFIIAMSSLIETVQRTTKHQEAVREVSF